MSCPTQDPRCLNQGYCTCGFYDDTAEAAGGCGGVLFLLFIGIFAAFLYPAIRISRSNVEFDSSDTPKFAGAMWLITSPLFGFLANMLYQIVFSIGACAAEATNSYITTPVYIAGMWLIYALAIGLAVLALIIKNRTAIKLFVIEPSGRSLKKGFILAGLLFMTLLFFASGAGVIFSVTDGYYTVQKNLPAAPEKEKPKPKNKPVHSR